MCKKINIADVKAAASGRWLEIFSAIAPNLNESIAKLGKHCACPVHGGSDGFRLFKDSHKQGACVCNTCGVQKGGIDTLMWSQGWDFNQALKAVSDYLGGDFSSVSSKDWVLEKKKAAAILRNKEVAYRGRLEVKYQSLWDSAIDVKLSNVAVLYFQKRGIDILNLECNNLRFIESLPYFDEQGVNKGSFSAILALVTDKGGIATIHRTYITSRGFKAPVPQVKKIFPVALDKKMSGNVVELAIAGVNTRCDVLGICEGIETALSVQSLWNVACVAALNTTLLTKANLTISDSIKKVVIFADKDSNKAGKTAALALKKRLDSELSVEVQICYPKMAKNDVDFNDYLMSKIKK